ncbi:MAG: hypothetical protein KDD61_07405 [Bdellovibrionales bacterium]|nr:hypothetical protein [Bdellovibrionales bacterium]
MGRPLSNETRFFSAKDLGSSLKKVASDIVTMDEHRLTSQWYHSDRDVDLYLWIDDNQNVIKQRMQLCGQLIEWNVLEGIRTGFVTDEENGVGLEDVSFRYDSNPIFTTVRQATDLVQYILDIEEALKFKIIENFVESPDIKTLSAEDFLSRYGKPVHCESTLSGWSKLIQKISRIWK